MDEGGVLGGLGWNSDSNWHYVSRLQEHSARCLRRPHFCLTGKSHALRLAICRPRISLADAEAAEDLAEQVVRGEFACNGAERGVREAQFLGEDLPPVELAARNVDVAARVFERAQMALAREEPRLP